MFSRWKRNIKLFFQLIKEDFMSHESYESKPDKPSTAAIVGGSVTMFFGAVITPFFFPVGVPLLVIGGALVASGSGVKINDKVKEIS